MVLLCVSTKVLLVVIVLLLLLLMMSSEGTGSLACEGRLVMSVSTLLVRPLGLLLMSSITSSSVMVVGALVLVHIGSVMLSLGWVGGDEFEGLLDLSWDWWGSGQMVANGTVSILIGGVSDGIVLTIVTRVRVSSLDSDSSSVTDLLQLTLGISRDTIAGLVAEGGKGECYL